jgi:hypothetical protein
MTPIAKQPITEADYERITDARVLERIRTDPRYKHAENAEDQAEAEEAIMDEVAATMRRDYQVSS